MFVQNVFVDTHDLRLPWVAFFTLCDVAAGSELTWDYGYSQTNVNVVCTNDACQCALAHTLLAEVVPMVVEVGSIVAELDHIVVEVGSMVAELGPLVAELGPLVAEPVPMVAAVDRVVAEVCSMMAEVEQVLAVIGFQTVEVYFLKAEIDSLMFEFG
ncbi:hypothetical protein GE061_015202 [Apolygus lucorum]|uniref:SET domain-containing protein n=1 Tax=Apolygus lucorum TaxID=248454 RepID=A0A8S9XPD2_APOLU|nr:hypothetical protein GE061_015202 [Apolygus lucorum]